MADPLTIPLDQLPDALPYTPSRWIRERKSGPNRYIVVHSMEAPKTQSRARNTATYFATTARQASTTVVSDDREIVRCVPDENGCFGAYGLNFNGLHIEHPGYAAQSTAEWMDDYGRANLTRTARLAAAWSLRYSIPLEYVGVQGLLQGRPGIVTHNDSTRAWNVRGGHTDPGGGFPMDWWVREAQRHLGQELPPPPEEEDMPLELVQAYGGHVVYSPSSNIATILDDMDTVNFYRFIAATDPKRVVDKLGAGDCTKALRGAVKLLTDGHPYGVR